MTDYFETVSIFGPSVLVMVLIVVVNWAFTAIHVYQEYRGKPVPLWRNFGAIVGVRLPDRLGVLFFTVGLTLILWALGLAAITGWLPIKGPLPPTVAIGALGAVIGARVSDTLVSHWGLYAVGYRPNPGIGSTPLYVLEAIFLLVAFRDGLSLEPTAAWIGFAGGIAAFVIVLPSIWIAGLVFPSWRHSPSWIRGRDIPDWADQPG